jgi:putative MATE family efflux protein
MVSCRLMMMMRYYTRRIILQPVILWMLIINGATAFDAPSGVRYCSLQSSYYCSSTSLYYCTTPTVSSFSSTTRRTQYAAQKDPTKDVDTPSTINYHWNHQNMAIALPAMIGVLDDQLLSLMDTAFVGRVGSTELAALGACTSIFHLAFHVFRATTAATTSLVASSLQKSKESARRVTAASLWLGLSLGIGVWVALYTGGNFFMTVMGVTSSSPLRPAASEYLFTRAWAAPAVLLLNVAEGAFRGYGDTVVPLLASLTAACINLVLDPFFIFTAGWGVKGAAAATVLAQFVGVAVYAYKLTTRGMLPARKKNKKSSIPAPKPVVSAPDGGNTEIKSGTVIRTILGANASMLVKQGSLLLGWSYATARATRISGVSIAAHQVALSVWLVFALLFDGPATSAQVLMSRAYSAKDTQQVHSLCRYMIKTSVVLGVAAGVAVRFLDYIVSTAFTPDVQIQIMLRQLMPILAWQQILVSTTLIVESRAVGASQFKMLALGTTVSSVASVWQLSQCKTVQGIWSTGIVTLFVGRLLTAAMALFVALRRLNRFGVPYLSKPAD